MAWLLISLPAVEARAVHDRVTAMAKVLAVEEGEQRTLDQLRADVVADLLIDRSEEHTSELQSLMRSSYAVFCLKKKKTQTLIDLNHQQVYTSNTQITNTQ